MAKYELKLDREVCTSNFVCTALKGEPRGETVHINELDEPQKREGEQAANGCPVMAIELIDAESGDKIAP